MISDAADVAAIRIHKNPVRDSSECNVLEASGNAFNK